MLIKTLTICITLGVVFAQGNTFNGIVIDSEKETPIPSANIQIKNSELGTSSDDLGKFSLDIKTNDILLKKLPLVKTKSNFIINLNEKIDEYESNKFSFASILNDLFSKNNTPKLVGVLSIFVIVSFSMFKISDLDVLPISDNNLLETPQIAINDADSLNDMENDMPILLIGNEK